MAAHQGDEREDARSEERWRIEFTPGGAHFFMGGVRINERCETSLEGLFAAGEVSGAFTARTGWGDARLTEIIVFGRRAGQYAAAIHQEQRSDRAGGVSG